jgi:5'-3' exonuclease
MNLENSIPTAIDIKNKTERQKLYIFDISAIVFRYHFAMKDANDIDGNPNGGILGVVVNSLRFLKKDKNALFCWVFDGAKNNFRKEILPTYKNHRPATDLCIINQLI